MRDVKVCGSRWKQSERKRVSVEKAKARDHRKIGRSGIVCQVVALLTCTALVRFAILCRLGDHCEVDICTVSIAASKTKGVEYLPAFQLNQF